MEQTRISVSFRDKESEKKLYEWIIKKSEVIGTADAVKQILYEKMKEEQKQS